MAVFLSPDRAGQGGRGPPDRPPVQEKAFRPKKIRKANAAHRAAIHSNRPMPIRVRSLPIPPSSANTSGLKTLTFRTPHKNAVMGPKSANTLVSGWNRPARRPIAALPRVPSRIRRFLFPKKRACTAPPPSTWLKKNTAARLSELNRAGCVTNIYVKSKSQSFRRFQGESQ